VQFRDLNSSVAMLPDLRWNELFSQDLFFPQPRRFIELVSCIDDDVEVTTGELAAGDILPWLDGQVS
jgi:hypothetical protein